MVSDTEIGISRLMLSLLTLVSPQALTPPVLRPEGAPADVVQGAQGGLHLLALCFPRPRTRTQVTGD